MGVVTSAISNIIMARPVAAPSLPNKEGYVTEYRGRLHGWRRCYLKLERTYLHSYEAQHSPAPIKSLVRSDITGVCAHTQRNDHTIEVTTRKHGKNWYIEIPEGELHEWRRCLVAHLPSAQIEANSTAVSVEEPSLVDQLGPLPRYMSDVPPPYEDCLKPPHQT